MSQEVPKVMCGLEILLRIIGFRLTHDGQRNPGQFQLPPDDVTYYTRTYRGWLDGKPINAEVKFIYDRRNAFIGVDLNMPKHKREKMVMTDEGAKEVLK